MHDSLIPPSSPTHHRLTDAENRRQHHLSPRAPSPTSTAPHNRPFFRMRSLLALALALASAPGLVQACGFSAFGDLPGIEEVCKCWGVLLPCFPRGALAASPNGGGGLASRLRRHGGSNLRRRFSRKRASFARVVRLLLTAIFDQALCSFECAELLVPFVDDCVKMMESMPPANFPFTIPNLVTFAASCRCVLHGSSRRRIRNRFTKLVRRSLAWQANDRAASLL